MKLLLIDDDVNLGKVISHQLRKSGYEVDFFADGKKGLDQFAREEYQIVISDIQMPGISGIDILKRIRQRNSDVIIILITAFGSVDNAIEACRLGADDYITKPFGHEQLLFTLEKAQRLRQLQTENRDLRVELKDKFSFANMVANSGLMQDVLRLAHKVAVSEASVMILGESGTGKELIARGIHFNSPRREKPFVAVNCPSIPENLLESELFGHVKGAFTGAIKDHAGKFELAEGGTILLDEIGDLRLDLQAKLLRVIQEREIERVGGSKPIKIDVRIIASTNLDLVQLMAEKKFREDLYYRLSVVPISLPPLRERPEEIPFLLDFFLNKYAADKNLRFSPEGMKILQGYSWPGNVRELENIVERSVVLATGELISPEDLPTHVSGEPAPSLTSTPEAGLTLDEAERRAIVEALKKSNGNKSKAARLLEIPRHVLLYRLKKLNISDLL